MFVCLGFCFQPFTYGVNIYSKTSLNRPILNGPFREVVGLRSYNIITLDIGEWSFCGGDRLERFYSNRSPVF